MEEVFAEHTGQPVERIARDTDRDYNMSAQEAVDYGMVNHILRPARLRPVTSVNGAAAKVTS